MVDYQEMYFQIVSRIADAIEVLIDALQQGEEEYIKNGNNEHAGIVLQMGRGKKD